MPNVCGATGKEDAVTLAHPAHAEFEEHKVHTPVTFTYPAGQAGRQPRPPRIRTRGAMHAEHDAGWGDEQAAQLAEQAPRRCDELQ
jgi:hypothetical protein